MAYFGGGLYLYSSTATLEGNTVFSNSAGYSGGGLYLEWSAPLLVNNVVAANQVGDYAEGSGIFMILSTPCLSHNTIAGNRGGDGSGIHVRDGSTVLLTDTILVSQTVGVTVTAGCTATLEATLWGGGTWASGTDWGGAGTIVTGTINLWGDPLFRDPDADDYHLRFGSPAIDAGVDAGIRVDLDGESRPYGAGYDLGADEFAPALQLANLASASRVSPGTLLTYTLVLTNSGLVPLSAALTDTLPAYVTPTGVLTWTTSLTPGAVWNRTMAVVVAAEYTGPLTNVLAVWTAEGPEGTAVNVVYVYWPTIYLPLVMR
jgi:uncharacterized repeat protein (TIGR01451 family)